ncbi:hypothetical protein [Hymenobacter crusticola]|uniref:Uncharacterized protein n=1 Tax=Hymenobacter crusticola TaxID=1770526 RepID=A0A243WJ92_9BACT|nr:hypothetical protein [Hymenobacter crusticola]OUJ75946.1 hypothetical protein BXP70_01270 [Hymenobacter crusticola]
MITCFLRSARPAVWLLALSCLLTTACHSYRIPSPTGPPQAKVKAAKGKEADATEAADGSTTAAAPKPQRNSYDKNGLLKKPKYERRRVKRKVGQRKFLGIILPF